MFCLELRERQCDSAATQALGTSSIIMDKLTNCTNQHLRPVYHSTEENPQIAKNKQEDRLGRQ